MLDARKAPHLEPNRCRVSVERAPTAPHHPELVIHGPRQPSDRQWFCHQTALGCPSDKVLGRLAGPPGARTPLGWGQLLRIDLAAGTRVGDVA